MASLQCLSSTRTGESCRPHFSAASFVSWLWSELALARYRHGKPRVRIREYVQAQLTYCPVGLCFCRCEVCNELVPMEYEVQKQYGDK